MRIKTPERTFCSKAHRILTKPEECDKEGVNPPTDLLEPDRPYWTYHCCGCTLDKNTAPKLNTKIIKIEHNSGLKDKIIKLIRKH